MGWMVIIGHQSDKSTIGSNNDNRLQYFNIQSAGQTAKQWKLRASLSSSKFMKFLQQPVFHPTSSNNSINQNGAHMLLETLIRMPHISLSVGVAYMGVDDNFILRHLRDFRRLKAKWSRLFALNLISLWRVGSGVWRVVRGQIRILIHKMFDCLDCTCLFVPLSNLQWHCL